MRGWHNGKRGWKRTADIAYLELKECARCVISRLPYRANHEQRRVSQGVPQPWARVALGSSLIKPLAFGAGDNQTTPKGVPPRLGALIVDRSGKEVSRSPKALGSSSCLRATGPCYPDRQKANMLCNAIGWEVCTNSRGTSSWMRLFLLVQCFMRSSHRFPMSSDPERACDGDGKPQQVVVNESI